MIYSDWQTTEQIVQRLDGGGKLLFDLLGDT